MIYGKTPKEVSEMRKEAKLALVHGIVENATPPQAYEKWLRADEERLAELKLLKIEMGDTALGRIAAVRKRELYASVPTMNEEERANLRMKLDQLDGVVPTAI